jgi:hypothetical protein
MARPCTDFNSKPDEHLTTSSYVRERANPRGVLDLFAMLLVSGFPLPVGEGARSESSYDSAKYRWTLQCWG